MEQIQKTKEKRAAQEEEVEVPAPEVDAEIEAHKAHTEELLDEIDALLEEDAETFVSQFIQRGGE